MQAALGRPLNKWDLCPKCGEPPSDHLATTGSNDLRCRKSIERTTPAEIREKQRAEIAKARQDAINGSGALNFWRRQELTEIARKPNRRLVIDDDGWDIEDIKEPKPKAAEVNPGAPRKYFDE